MTTRIETFDDTVTSAVTPVTTNITGATGSPGRAFQVDEFTDFSEAKRAEIEAYGTPTVPASHGVVTALNPFVVVVQIDNRSAAERSAGPAPLNADLSRHVIEWNGATATGGGNTWFDYGEFSGLAGSVWHTGTGVPADSLGVETDMYLDITTGAGRGDVYQKGVSTWGSPIVNIGQTASQAINVTTASGLSGDGTTGTPLALLADGSTITLSVSGIKISDTITTKLGRYPDQATDGLFLRGNSLNNYEEVTIADATTSTSGFMSGTDKTKLDKYTTPADQVMGADSVDNDKINQVTVTGAMELVTPTKSTVGLNYIPDEFNNTLGYSVDDLVFFEGVNYRARVNIAMPTPPATLSNPDDDATSWLSLGGGHIIVDATSGSNVALTPRGNLRFLGNVQVDDDAGNSATNVTITGESPADFNLFADGNLDFALASSYTTTGNGTFAISSANVLRGDRSGNWTAVSNASTLTSPSIPIPLGYRDQLVQFSLVYRSTDEVTLELLNGSTVISTQTLDAFTETNGSRKIKVFQQLRSDQTSISFRFSSSSVTTFTFDDVVITDDFNAVGQQTNVRRFTSDRPPISSSGIPEIYNNIIDWGVENTEIFNTTEGSGGALLSYARDTTNGSSWTVLEDCRVTGFYSIGINTAGGVAGWTLDGTLGTEITSLSPSQVISSTSFRAANTLDVIPISFDVKKDQVLRCQVSSIGIPLTQQPRCRLSIQAEIIETQDVTVYNAQTSAANSFSARCDGKLTGTATNRIYSQSNSFVSSVVRDSLGVFTVNFVTGTFGQIPSVLASVIDTDTNSDRQIAVVNTSITSCQITIEATTDNGPRDENFDIIVNRQGSDVRSQTANFTIPRISADENTFRALFTGDATQVIQTQTPRTFVSAYSRTATGRYTMTLDTGIFTVMPIVQATCVENGTVTNSASCAVDSYNASTGVLILDTILGTAAINADQIMLSVTRNGVDYVSPEVVDVPTQAIQTISDQQNEFILRYTPSSGTATLDTTYGPGNSASKGNGNGTFTGGSWTIPIQGFTVAPDVKAMANSPGQARFAVVNSVSTTSVVLSTYDGGGTVNDDVSSLDLVITARGADYKAPELVTVQTPLIRPNEPFLFQRKTNASAITATGDAAVLSFSNLEVGKVYRIGGLLRLAGNASGTGSGSFRSAASGAGDEYGLWGIERGSGDSVTVWTSVNTIFTATSTGMFFNAGTLSSSSQIDANSYITLEELPYHEATTKWT